MARIGIEATQLSPTGKGHARTQRGAIEALARLGSGHELVAFVRGPEAEALLAASGVRTRAVGEANALLWEQRGIPRAMREERLDAMLLFTERLPVAGGGPFVVWLFELPTHRAAQNRASGASAYQRASDLVTAVLWRRSLRRAAAVVCGSYTTARELAAAVPGLGETTVVHPGLEPRFSPGAGREGRYVLALASPDPRDNSAAVLAACVRAGAPVVVAGSGPVPDALAGSVTRLGWVGDDELVDLYRGAACFVDCPLYEGFGYQPVEAMACGAPVVCSNAGSLPEVVGEAALLVDPARPDEIEAAVRRVLAEPALAAELRRRGSERAARYTWDSSARALLERIEAVL